MGRAVEFSRRGWPAPNPHVGCVVVKQGRIIGEGWHHHAGGPHAEVMALAEAGSKARGSDVYVTLEPCSHFGRTPPCSAALIRSKVKRVVYALPDPNPKASGGGRALAEAGVQVQSGLLAKEAAEVNAWWLASQILRRPVVILKAAVTSDGFMARPDGTSKWITNEESRLEGHRLRATMGSVLVGWRTVQIDDPELTARILEVVNQPRAVVLDPSGKLTGKERVLNREGSLWIKAAEHEGSTLTLQQGRYEVNDLLEFLRSQGIMGVLVEGGAGALQSFVDADIWDELHLFVGSSEFSEGLSAPKRILELALLEGLPAGVERVEVLAHSGADRHILVKKRPGLQGTISDWLGSIPTANIFYPSP